MSARIGHLFGGSCASPQATNAALADLQHRADEAFGLDVEVGGPQYLAIQAHGALSEQAPRLAARATETVGDERRHLDDAAGGVEERPSILSGFAAGPASSSRNLYATSCASDRSGCRRSQTSRRRYAACFEGAQHVSSLFPR